MADLPNVPEDLGGHADQLIAIQQGFISDDEPERVASRSVVGVVAGRIYTNYRKALVRRDEAREGDLIVITGGIPAGDDGKTNFIKVHRV